MIPVELLYLTSVTICYDIYIHIYMTNLNAVNKLTIIYTVLLIGSIYDIILFLTNQIVGLTS